MYNTKLIIYILFFKKVIPFRIDKKNNYADIKSKYKPSRVS